MNIDFEHLKQWIGKVETRSELAASIPVQALAATLDRDDPAPRPRDGIPPCWHWLYFLPLQRQSEIGPDGHSKRGGFLPPVPLPRRMWAGSKIEFLRSLRVGETISKTSRIAAVNLKEGRTGPLVFVRVRHEVADELGPAVVEEQDIVYRGHSAPGEPAPDGQPARADHEWIRELRADEVLLFRYSALTFNGHRIHYDRPYATEVEGYPGLVVHGPLVATLLLELLRCEQPRASLTRFAFRGVRPLFDDAPFFVCGRRDPDGQTISLWAKDRDGYLAMEATAMLG